MGTQLWQASRTILSFPLLTLTLSCPAQTIGSFRTRLSLTNQVNDRSFVGSPKNQAQSGYCSAQHTHSIIDETQQPIISDINHGFCNQEDGYGQRPLPRRIHQRSHDHEVSCPVWQEHSQQLSTRWQWLRLSLQTAFRCLRCGRCSECRSYR